MPSSQLSKLSDAELATLALAENDYAFAQLVLRYSDAIFRHTTRLTGNKQDGEDIAQETFVRLFTNLSKLDFSQPLNPWLFRVATNLCRNHAKKKKSLSFSQLESEDEESKESVLDSVRSEEPIPGEFLETQGNIDEVRKAVNKLPKKYQLVLTLYYWENLSYEEIAQTISLPVNTVRTHIRRAKALLYSNLKNTLS